MKIEDLAKRAGVSPRTVRYYVQRGLLPAPAFHGRDTAYDEEHLFRLRAIRKLQERFLPLDTIEAELKQRPLEQIKELAAGVEKETRHPAPKVPVVPRQEAWARIEVAPGLEIHLSDRADAMTRSLAEELRALAERRKTGGAK